MKRSSEPDFVGLANQRLVSTLTRNLLNMEHFSRRDAVSFHFRLRASDQNHVFAECLDELCVKTLTGLGLEMSFDHNRKQFDLI